MMQRRQFKTEEKREVNSTQLNSSQVRPVLGHTEVYREMSNKAAFEANAFYERLVNLRSKNRKTFESLSPPTKLALAQYEQSKREHEQAEVCRDTAT
jgi:hypothetical protein